MSEQSMLSEARALSEYWQLQADPVFHGRTSPRGQGRVVLVLPGLFGTDFYLYPLRTWLTRIGYTPIMSNIGINAGCSRRLLDRVYDTLPPTLTAAANDIAIIGHSRGGMLGKALINRLENRVSHFITIGSPLGGMLRGGQAGLADLAAGSAAGNSAGSAAGSPVASEAVVNAGRAAMRLLDPDCDSPLCGCQYIDDLLTPLPEKVKVTAIYSSDDPVVASHACLIDGAENIEVTGSHSGLFVNRHVYPHIASALAT